MREIKNVLICGLGAIGTIYAEKLRDCTDLRILTDKERFERYTKNPIIFNGKKLNFNYILPEEKNFTADLIIIATKFNGLFDSIKNIKNFVGENTIIMSLLNGVTGEKFIADKYGNEKVLYSYFIGHSSMREGRSIKHDGVNKIVFGSVEKSENIQIVRNFFDKVGINYIVPNDIIYSMWLKYMLNVSSNQISAILRMTFGEMMNNPKCMEFIVETMKEVQIIAKAEGVKNTDKMIDDALLQFRQMSPEGKTSMLQDIEAGRKTEVEIFAGDMIKFGKKHNIPTPYNTVLKGIVEIIQG